MISSSSAPARRVRSSPSGCRRAAAIPCWCWRPAARDRRFYVQMPLGYGKTFFDPAVNWNYRTEPDPGLAGNTDHWPRGKILGGSSSINAMVWIRGQREDFDAWSAAGNPGWSFDELLPAFKAIEDNEAGADAWRGAGGPVHVKDCRAAVHPLTQRYLEGRAAGRPAAQPGLQRREPGRRRRLPDQRQERPPHVGRARLPAAGDEAEKRARRDERAGDEDPVRGHAAPSVSNTSSAAARTPSAPRARSSSAAAPSTRRSFCNCPASAPPRCCKASAYRSSTPTPMSAPTFRIMSASTTPSRAGCRRSTRSCAPGGASFWSACNTSFCAAARCRCR